MGVARDVRFAAAVKVPVGASAFREVSHEGRVDLTLATPDSAVRGRVVDHLGNGVAGVEVELEQSRVLYCGLGLHRPVPKTLPVCRRVVSNADGAFAFRTSRSWDVLVWPRVARLRCGPSMFAISGDGDLQLEIPGRAVLRGVVLDWRGEPVPGCEVWAGEPGFEIRFDTATGSLVTADAEGRFEMPFLKGGPYVIAALGTATSPAGEPVTIDVPEKAPGWIELRTAEPASIEGKVLGARGRPIRIVARPPEDGEGRAREITRTGDGEFVLRDLMRGGKYDLVAYLGDDEFAHDTGVVAGNGDRSVLRNGNWDAGAVSCRLRGDGMQQIAGKEAHIAVHPILKAPKAESHLAKPVTEVVWRGETEVRFDDLLMQSSAVAALMVDGVENARSEPFRLRAEPALAVLESRADGSIDLRATPGKPDWCVRILRADGSGILGREELTWQGSDEVFRCTLPAGEYRLQVGYEGDRGLREMSCSVEPGKTQYMRLP